MAVRKERRFTSPEKKSLILLDYVQFMASRNVILSKTMRTELLSLRFTFQQLVEALKRN